MSLKIHLNPNLSTFSAWEADVNCDCLDLQRPVYLNVRTPTWLWTIFLALNYFPENFNSSQPTTFTVCTSPYYGSSVTMHSNPRMKHSKSDQMIWAYSKFVMRAKVKDVPNMMLPQMSRKGPYWHSGLRFLILQMRVSTVQRQCPWNSYLKCCHWQKVLRANWSSIVLSNSL